MRAFAGRNIDRTIEYELEDEARYFFCVITGLFIRTFIPLLGIINFFKERQR